MFKAMLAKMMERKNLTRDEAYLMMKEILSGNATPSQISCFISLVTFRGVEAEELIGLTEAMRDFAQILPVQTHYPIVDTCGTGGAGAKTFNVSTASALVASSTGLRVAKHGNRAVTSQTGSADVLQELGLEVDLTPEEMARCLEEYHMCFMFAPLYHQAMRFAATTRKEIGIRTVFNLLGPMTNPAGAKHQVIGVFDFKYSLIMAEALRELGSEHVLIVAAEDGLDEFSIASSTRVTELKDGEIRQYSIEPEDVGITRISSLESLRVSSPVQSAEVITRILRGEEKGSAYDMVCYNAGAALYVGKKVANIAEGVQLARQAIDSKQALEHYLKMRMVRGAVENA
ncbi:anthranilate phosphoribosyltransferase [Caldalkalibacillus mannanilyticus]|uniref:anthranilate phosphoribosyltransferase n=1 Tax=Caldalkalibacillus mannanilyticus TaxID=1418 RepID=UPI00046A72D0|nr:anthranilate phosphoribosyltransferase [Caldalkalibacillus mannanilyticus]